MGLLVHSENLVCNKLRLFNLFSFTTVQELNLAILVRCSIKQWPLFTCTFVYGLLQSSVLPNPTWQRGIWTYLHDKDLLERPLCGDLWI